MVAVYFLDTSALLKRYVPEIGTSLAIGKNPGITAQSKAAHLPNPC